MKVWKHCLKNEKLVSKLKDKVIGVKSQMQTFDLFSALNLATCLYYHTDNLAKSVQNKGLSEASTKRLADLTIQILKSRRSEEHFRLFQVVLKKVKGHPFADDPILSKKRKSPNYTILQYIEGYGQSDKEYHPDSPETHYRQIYYEAVNCLTTFVKERFTHSSFIAYEKL